MPAKKPAAAVPARVNKSAEKLLSQAIDMMASSGGLPLSPDNIRSAALPFTGGKTMLDVQKFRVNWYALERKALGRIARLVVDRNWFASTVHKINKGLYGSGFRFQDPQAQDWAAGGTYPFKRVHDDILEEYLISDSVVAFWRTDAAVGSLPVIEIPDMEDVDYSVLGGVPRIELTIQRNPKLSEVHRPAMGEAMWNAVRTGKRLCIIKGDPASGFDFEILKAGKISKPIAAPALTSILDDLDFIEAVRVGDWNGAWSRREILRHTKTGYGVSSGPNAGTARNNAKYAEIQAILKAMKSIMGKTDVATNFDQDISWVAFSKDFFGAEMVEAALQRLIFWGGLAAILLLKTDSQITGLSGFLTDRTRVQVEAFREEFSPFLASIFNAPSFRKNFPDAPPLVPAWSVKPLYTGDALTKLATFYTTNAVVAPQTLREMLGIDDAVESARLRDAHTRREDFTPPYEPRQGLLPNLFPEDFPGTTHPALK
jgi:hypothetical protein